MTPYELVKLVTQLKIPDDDKGVSSRAMLSIVIDAAKYSVGDIGAGCEPATRSDEPEAKKKFCVYYTDRQGNVHRTSQKFDTLKPALEAAKRAQEKSVRLGGTGYYYWAEAGK